MSIIKKAFNIFKNEDSKHSIFYPIFLEGEERDNFPYSLAVQSLGFIEDDSQNEEDLRYYCLEDSIFSSLYATYYEEMLVSIKNNPHMAKALINKFAESAEVRDQNIAKQAQLHVNYIISNGNCPGCACCEDHADVDELITPWEAADTDFFLNVYVGMQTIQHSLDQLLFEYLPENLESTSLLTRENIFKYRTDVFNYAEKRFHE